MNLKTAKNEKKTMLKTSMQKKYVSEQICSDLIGFPVAFGTQNAREMSAGTKDFKKHEKL